MPGKRKHLKTPTVIQMEATECGAAALGIILAYYGKYIPLEKLRIQCAVSRDGSNALNILKAARQYDLKAQGAKIEIEDLHKINLPVIAFWEFNHFVVIEGFSKKKIYINDPATGPRTITYQDFDRSFTGIILIFEPTPLFKPSGRKTSPYRSLWTELKKIPSALSFVILLSITLVIPGILIPGFSKIFIDNILIQQVSGWLLPLIWGLLLTGLLRMLLSYLQQYYLIRLQLKVMLVNSVQFFWHILHLPFSFFSQRFAGDIQSRIESNNRIAAWLTQDLSINIVNLISMFFYAIIMFLYDWILTAVTIFIALINFSLLVFINRNLQNSSSRLQQELGKLQGVEMNGLQTIETLKATSSEDAFFQRWAGYHAQTLNSQQNIQLYSRSLLVFSQLLNGLLAITILGLGGLRIIQGDLTIGGLIAFQSLLMSFNAPLLSLIGFGSKVQQLRGDLLRLEDVNKNPEDLRFSTAYSNTIQAEDKSLKYKGDLSLQKISFGYSHLQPPLLEEIDFIISPGKKIAIVGTSGSGKSTLAKLICGLYQPWSGNILWNNQEINKIPLNILSHSLSFVDQDIFLFEGSIRDNLTLWNNFISDESIERALIDAELQELLYTRTHGLESQVMYAGYNFSGGQRQQLEIARALAVEPSVLILDEATASLDGIVENKIMENLKKRDCSLLVIAHRLSAVYDSDEIIVLVNGKIAERGKHEQLIQKKNYYYKLMYNVEGS